MPPKKPIIVNACEAPAEETWKLEFKSEIDDIAKQFPETISIDIPEIDLGWLGKVGGKTVTVNVRQRVKDLLNAAPTPALEATFEADGSCDDIEGTTIECTDSDVIDTDGGGAQVVNVGVDYEFTAKVKPGAYKTEPCKCENGANGKMRTRRFHIKWYLKLTMNPGIRGNYPITDFWVTVLGCCCCSKIKEGNGEGGDNGGDNGGKQHKKKGDKPSKPKGKPKRGPRSPGSVLR